MVRETERFASTAMVDQREVGRPVSAALCSIELASSSPSVRTSSRPSSPGRCG
jgi:hypothetical protein